MNNEQFFKEIALNPEITYHIENKDGYWGYAESKHYGSITNLKEYVIFAVKQGWKVIDYRKIYPQITAGHREKLEELICVKTGNIYHEYVATNHENYRHYLACGQKLNMGESYDEIGIEYDYVARRIEPDGCNNPFFKTKQEALLSLCIKLRDNRILTNEELRKVIENG